MCLEGDFLTEKAYIKVKNENKQLNNAKRQTDYLVCNIENGTVPFVYGIERRQAYQWGYTSKGYWRIADSWILARAIGDESLRRAGYSWIGCYYSASALPKG